MTVMIYVSLTNIDVRLPLCASKNHVNQMVFVPAIFWQRILCHSLFGPFLLERFLTKLWQRILCQGAKLPETSFHVEHGLWRRIICHRPTLDSLTFSLAE